MGYVEVLTDIVEKELDRIATEIEAELKSEVSAKMKRTGKRSGAAIDSIHIERDSDLSRFIGANINWGDYTDGGLHLYYFDQGNRPRGGGRIYPTRSKALHLKNIGDNVYAASVKPYSGAHVVSDVADKHR